MYFTRYLLHKNILYDIYTCTHVAHIIARLRVVCCGAYDVLTDHCTRQLFKNLQSVFYLKIYILYSVLVAIFSDVGGLIIGKTFKGKKLTKISPNKTISGSVGSFFFSLLLIPLFMGQLTSFNFLILILITLLISLISQLGDLFISFLKRKAKVKNTSDILPGHGGFLDRVDGIIFAIPLGIMLLNTF